MGNNNGKARTFLLELAKCGENALRRLKFSGLTSPGHCSGWDPTATDDSCTDNITAVPAADHPRLPHSQPPPPPGFRCMQAQDEANCALLSGKGLGNWAALEEKKRLSESSSPLQSSQLHPSSWRRGIWNWILLPVREKTKLSKG